MKTEKAAFWLEVSKAAVAVIVAVAASWYALDKRLTVVETRQDAIEQSVEIIRTDIREIRDAVIGRGARP
jgi:hypothetical protein